MKKILSLILCAALAASMCACGGRSGSSDNREIPSGGGSSGSSDNGEIPSGGGDVGTLNPSTGETFIEQTAPNSPVTLGIFYRNTIGADIVSNNPAVKTVDEKADALLENIEDAPDTLTANGGKTYYISADGDDTNDGLSPETARQSYMAVKALLQAGDLVLFRRGDIFRGQVQLISGVSYGAYGSGIKPRFYGSTNGLDGEWTETETKDVYKFSQSIGNYSNIVFNNGEAVGRPVQNLSQITKKELSVCWQGKIYLYSPKGNPADVFDSIEIVDGYTLITQDNNEKIENVTIQNLCIMYAGYGGINISNAHNITIEGCISGFIGGVNLWKGEKSLGNAIQFWAVATDISVRNNYIFQCYDTAISHQGPINNEISSNYTNIHYENNLIEYCVWGIEAWYYHQNNDKEEHPENTWNYNDVYIENNIIRHTGWGWGSLDRPDKNVYADIMYDAKAHVKPLVISGNIFDRSRRNAICMRDYPNSSMLLFTDNTFILKETSRIAAMGGWHNITLNEYFPKNGIDSISEYFGTFSGNRLVTVQ